MSCDVVFIGIEVLVKTCFFTYHIQHSQSRMNRSGGEAFARLAQQLNRARLSAQGGGGGGRGGGGGGGIPGGFKGFMAGGGLLAVLAGGGLILNYSLFNGVSCVFRCYGVRQQRRLLTVILVVDGGHRAIKYSRLHGIRSDIYPEGTHLVVGPSIARPHRGLLITGFRRHGSKHRSFTMSERNHATLLP